MRLVPLVISITSFVFWLYTISLSIGSYKPVVKADLTSSDNHIYSGTVSLQDTKYDIFVSSKTVTKEHLLAKYPSHLLDSFSITATPPYRTPLLNSINYLEVSLEDLPPKRQIVNLNGPTFRIGEFTSNQYYQDYKINFNFKNKIINPQVLFSINEEYFRSYRQNPEVSLKLWISAILSSLTLVMYLIKRKGRSIS